MEFALSLVIMAVTLLVVRWSPMTNLADLRCTISNLPMLLVVWGSQVILPYSMIGQTREVKHKAMVLLGKLAMFL